MLFLEYGTSQMVCFATQGFVTFTHGGEAVECFGSQKAFPEEILR